MLVPFDIKFIRRDQIHRWKGEACRTIRANVWSRLINLISKDTGTVFYLSCMIRRPEGVKRIKQMKIKRSVFQVADVANAP